MDIASAFAYLLNHAAELKEKNRCIAGVSHTPGNHNGEFHVISLAYEDLAVGDGEPADFQFSATYQQANLGNPFPFTSFDSDADLDELTDRISALAFHMQFKVYPLEEIAESYPLEVTIQELFPDRLINPSDENFNLDEFQAKAIELIEQVNKPNFANA